MTIITKQHGLLTHISMDMVENVSCKMMETWLFIIMMANQLGAQELMVAKNKMMDMAKNFIFEYSLIF